MSTQGLVSLVDKEGKTLIKVIAGCNGYNAEILSHVINSNMPLNEIYEKAIEVGFGCDDCLVVMSSNEFFPDRDEPLHERYFLTFENPKFNPRWESGLCENTVVVSEGK